MYVCVFIYIYIYIYIYVKADTKNLWERIKMRATFWSDVLRDRNLIVSTVIMLVIRNGLEGLITLMCVLK